MHVRLVARPLAAALLLSLAACSAAASPTPSAGIAVSGAWVRAVASTGSPTAGYMTIANTGGQDDALTGATSGVASSLQVHETSMDSTGMTGMHPVDRIVVPAGGNVTLQQGGYHLMFMGLSRALKAGDTVEIVLTFEHAGKVVVEAEVRQG